MPTNMTTDAKAVRDTDLDQELADVLIAISVITRLLAKLTIFFINAST